ncbi:Prenyltransferase and squalene oxidase repeat-containing protein [Paenibacillus sp. 1_12]|uniref:prenyltransferase/squalene oxidase repeat-containing protein n=1 Tax=Paenibacillus sp. 1_12 TaxID=1566278 RepID=UPI0008E70C78|nr:prenyltransferase/squalene oxidase repeat-containing protein [Paenibacillus sp. 1_12]SFL43214.1 Prenyltransferase and squalene oxidase repeat-containing protein [Paenibacillus sp. 1_12]
MHVPSELFAQAKLFIYQNGRLLDRRRFEYFFENGSQEAVIAALAPYQNPDGGFGQGLEPDIRSPYSQPVPTESALILMDEIEYFDYSILKGIIRFLQAHTIHSGGVPLAFCSINDYPHAPWWNTDQDSQANMNPTGRILGLLYKQRTLTDFLEENWFQSAVAYVWNEMEKGLPAGYHDGVQWISFLQHTPERERAAAYLLSIQKWLTQPDIIERDPKADGYVHKVLDWAPSHESYAAQMVSDQDIEQHISYLVSQQQPDGGWPISWPAVSAAGELEWRGHLTVERLRTLRSFGWL